MDIKALFDHAAQSYDQTRRQYIPCFDEFYGTVLDLIPYEQEAEIEILDLGAGTGLLAALIAEAFPRASFTLVDISRQMLAIASQRFVSRSPPIKYCTMDYLKDPFPGEYDLIVSALSLHHSPENELRLVFKRLYHALHPGGLFINADQVRGPTAEIEEKYEQMWRHQVRHSGCSEENLAIAIERMKADKTATLRSQLTWLEEADFEMVNCWYKNYRFAVYSGRKSKSVISNQ